LEAESVVTVLVCLILTELHDLDEDTLLSFLVLENKLSSGLLVVLASLSDVLLVAELNSLVVNSDATITTVLSNNLDLAELLSWSDLDSLSILEANLTWLVIINNGDTCLGVLSNKFLVGVWLVELHEEVLIWLPVVVILNANVESFGVFTVTEFNNAIEWNVVLVGLGVTVDGASAHATSLSLFVHNSNSELSGRLTDGVMQALETEALILHVLVKLIGVSVLKLHLLIFGNDGSLSCHEVVDLLSVFDSADHSLSVNHLLKFVKTDRVNLVCVHGLLEESSHFVSSLLRIFILLCLTLSFNH
jgi:hypothetical protein